MDCNGCPGFFLSEFLPPSAKPCHRAENRSEFLFRNATFFLHSCTSELFHCQICVTSALRFQQRQGPQHLLRGVTISFMSPQQVAMHPPITDFTWHSLTKKSSEGAWSFPHLRDTVLHDISIIEKPQNNENFNSKTWFNMSCFNGIF